MVLIYHSSCIFYLLFDVCKYTNLGSLRLKIYLLSKNIFSYESHIDDIEEILYFFFITCYLFFPWEKTLAPFICHHLKESILIILVVFGA